MCGRLKRIIFSILGPQFGRPTEGVAGWLTSKILTRFNQVLEENAVMLCRISADDTVLELGHGPGLGLEAAAKLLSGPRGRLLGIDYSEYMHQVASEKLQELIANGKVTLHHCDVASMPIAESSVDKVFHCNCYYFWPDLKKGTREIHRVMKPGGLMVTTLNLSNLEHIAPTNMFTGESWHPDIYMEALQATGFSDVKMETRTDKFITFQVIFATASK